jgi:hypothetical protein
VGSPAHHNLARSQERYREVSVLHWAHLPQLLTICFTGLAWPLHKDDTLFRSGRPTGLNIYLLLIFSHFVRMASTILSSPFGSEVILRSCCRVGASMPLVHICRWVKLSKIKCYHYFMNTDRIMGRQTEIVYRVVHEMGTLTLQQ